MGAEPWGLYPPEINAGRYETGVGPLTWIAAAAEWGAMAAIVSETFAALGIEAGSLTGNWQGLASRRFGEVAVPFVSWLVHMEATALGNAKACADVVQAWIVGNATMVPLPVIIANRVAARTAQVASVLGAPNTEAVRLEIDYAAFWVHNGTVMTGYDIAANTATLVKTVPPPPPLVIGAGAAVTPQDFASSSNGQQQMMGQAQQQMSTALSRLTGGPGSQAGILNRYKGPSLSDAGKWSHLLGSGSGGPSGLNAGRLGGAGLNDELLPMPVLSLGGPSAAVQPSASNPVFSGVSNAASTTRPPIPMMPPLSGLGSKSKQSIPQSERNPIIAAIQEFDVRRNLDNAALEGVAQESENVQELRLS